MLPAPVQHSHISLKHVATHVSISGEFQQIVQQQLFNL